MNDLYKANRGQTSWKPAVFTLAAIFVLAIAIFAFNTKGVSLTGNAVKTNIQEQSPSTLSAKELMANGPVLGSSSAPVTIVEFTDAQCPFCRKGEATISQIMTDYSGKVKLVTRDFPLSQIHPSAMPAAIALRCVRDMGGDAGFYAFKAKILAEQNKRDGGSADSPVTKTVTFTNDDLISWAKELNFDIKSCLSSNKYDSAIQKDLSDGQAAGVQGTPAFFVIDKNGKSTFLSGAQPYSAFKTALDNALKA